MLSFSKGYPIARIEGGKYNGEVIHLFDPTDKKNDICCEKCDRTKCNRRKCCEQCKIRCGGCTGAFKSDIDQDNPIDIMNTDDIRRFYGKDIDPLKMDRLLRFLRKYRKGGGDSTNEYYENKDLLEEFKRRASQEIVLDEGAKIRPLPNNDQVQGERVFVAGPSGSGKSTWASKYIIEFLNMFKNYKFYIFSPVDSDECLDTLNPIRLKLNKDLVDDPIDVNELKNSVVLFDDIESIRDRKVKSAMIELRDAMLEAGRHAYSYVVCCSHQIANNKNTKVLLNESNAVTFFPKCGVHGIKYFLKEYCGLSKKQIEKVVNLPSRWVTIYRKYPIYILYEGGCFLLNSLKE